MKCSFGRNAVSPQIVASMVLALSLAACGDRNAAQNSAQKGQVIARVGDADVTIHELQNELRHLRVPPDRVNDEVNRQVINELVKRKALAQRAVAAKLDREPTVLLEILRSREQVLATTIMQRDLQSKFSAISKVETDRYINANPAKFSQRIRFDVDRLVVASQIATPEFMERVKSASMIDEIEKNLANEKLQYTRGASVVYASDIPAEMLKGIKARKETDIFAIVSGPSTLFVKVTGERLDPLTGEEANRVAANLIRQEMTQEELQRKVEVTGVAVTYFGDYEKIMGAQEQKK